MFKVLSRPFRRKSAPCSPAPSLKLRHLRSGSEGPLVSSNLSVKMKIRRVKRKAFPKINKKTFEFGVFVRNNLTTDNNNICDDDNDNDDNVDVHSLSSNSSDSPDPNYCLVSSFT